MNVEVSAGTLVIILDTQAIEEQVFQVTSGLLYELREEAKRRTIAIALTDVQVAEIRVHVAAQRDQVKSVAKKLSAEAGKWIVRKDGDGPAHGGVPLPRLLQHGQLRKALTELATTADRIAQEVEDFLGSPTVIIPTGHVTAARLTPQYFAARPPFGPGRKKYEFPDAISIEAIKDFAASAPNLLFAAVSGDNDWVRAFAEIPSVLLLPNVAAALQHVRGFDDIGARLQRLIVGHQTALNIELSERFPEVAFSIANSWGGDVEDVEVSSSDVVHLDILQSHTNRATARFEATIVFDAVAVYPDDDYSEWHHSYVRAHIRAQSVTVIGIAELSLSTDWSVVENSSATIAGPLSVHLNDVSHFTRVTPYTD